MATDKDVIIRVRVAADSQGIPQLVADLQKVAAAHENVTVATEKQARAELSAQKVFERRQRQFDMEARQAKESANLLRDIERFKQQGIGTGEDYNRMLAGMTQRHEAASRSQKSLADTTKLTRYEMINLSRQVQDVGVSLASGQSPFTVLVQQGTQIADVFAASQTTVRQFFSQAVGWAGRFVMSAGGVVTGVGAIAASAGLMAASWASAQTEIERGLLGIGRASGASRQDINNLARETSSAFGLSTSEAREMALALAGTGKIGVDQMRAIGMAAHDFAATLGVDFNEAKKILASAFADPVKGVEVFAQKFGLVSDAARQTITLLAEQGRKTEAQNALQSIMNNNIARASEVTSIWAQAWNAVGNAAAFARDKSGEAIASGLGIGRTPQKRMADAERDFRRAQDLGFSGEEIDDLRTKWAQARAEFDKPLLTKGVQELTDASVAAGNFARTIDDSDTKIRQLTAGIEQMRKVLDSPSRELLVADVPGMQRALAMAEQMRSFAQAQVAEVRALQDAYGGVSREMAVALANAEGQLNVARAITEQQKLAAQEVATTNALRLQSGDAEGAALLAAKQRAIAQAQINSEARRTVIELQDQLEVSRAVTASERMMAQERVKYNQLLRAGTPELEAQKIAALERANAEAQANAAAEATLLQLKDQLAIAQATTEQARLAAEEDATRNDLLRNGVNPALADAVAMMKTEIELARQLVEKERERRQEILAQIQAEKARAAAWHAAAEAQGKWLDGTRQSGNWLDQPAANKGFTTQPLWAKVTQMFQEQEAMKFGGLENVKFGPGLSLEPKEISPTGYEHFFTDIINQTFGQNGSTTEAILKLGQQFKTGPEGQSLMQMQQRLIDQAIFEGGDTKSIEDELERQKQLLLAEPRTLARDDLINQLNEQLEKLRASTDTLNDTMQIGLSDIWTTDPRLSRIGFRAESGALPYDPFNRPMPAIPATSPVPMPAPSTGTSGDTWNSFGVMNRRMALGGVLTPFGELPLKRFAFGGYTSGTVAFNDSGFTGTGSTGGVAHGPQVAMIGEGSSPEAYVPLPDGRSIPVTVDAPEWFDRVAAMYSDRTPRDRARPPQEVIINAPITINAAAGNDNQSFRQTAFQMRQAMSAAVASAMGGRR